MWLEDVPVSLVTEDIRQALSEEHLAHMVQNKFWRHVGTFPNFYKLTEDCVDHLKAVINFGHADVISSETSTFPYDKELTNHIIRFLEKVNVKKHDPHYTNTVARYMDVLTFERFMYFYGEKYARLSRQEGAITDYETSLSHSPLFLVFSPLLFLEPRMYFEELRKVYTDQVVHYYSWRKFITGLKDDWAASLTPATVLLSANVGFLAIQSVDNDPGSSYRSAAQIASYASALFSLANIAVVQILLRRHRQHLYETAERGLDFLTAQSDKFGGLELLAITVSLPSGLFGWSMITFFVAFMLVFYDNTTIPTRITLAIVLLILVLTLIMVFCGGRMPTGSHMVACIADVLWRGKLVKLSTSQTIREAKNSFKSSLGYKRFLSFCKSLNHIRRIRRRRELEDAEIPK